jgi:hypothetical protein
MSSGADGGGDDYRTAARASCGERGAEVARNCGELGLPRNLISNRCAKHDEQLGHAGGEYDFGFLACQPVRRRVYKARRIKARRTRLRRFATPNKAGVTLKPE